MVKRLVFKTRWRIVGLIFLGLGGICLGFWLWLTAGLPPVEKIHERAIVPSIRILDRHGRLLYEVIGDEPGRNRVVSLERIPLACQQATISTEDARFYTNSGIDAQGIIRALWINLQGGEVISGGSTLTQQVVRNLLLDPDESAERTLRRKLRESILAYRLTQHLTKDEILLLYLNQTYYGNLAYGMDAAARSYFGRTISDLSLAECSLIAGLPQAPALYDPLTDPEAARERQHTVLRLMREQGFITADQEHAAREETLRYAADRYLIEAPHFVSYVYDQLLENIPADTLYLGGLEVRTTLDLDWQHTAEAIMRRQIDTLNTPSIGNPSRNAGNAALVAMDPVSGEVLAMVGSVDFFGEKISGAVNMAMTVRQPGSTLKPFTYALAMDPTRPDPWTAATMVYDVRTSFLTQEGFSYSPVNFDRSEHGPVRVREALASSYNIPAVVALQDVGVSDLIIFLSNLGIGTLESTARYDLSLTLGGGEIRLLDLVSAYGAFTNGGHLLRPVSILEVVDSEERVIFRGEGGHGPQVIDSRVAWLISDILSDNAARTPAFSAHSILQIGQPAAVKTGTTTDFRDNWTVGYTPEVVVGVWVGNTDNAPMEDISGVSGAGPIWHHFMRTVLRGKPESTFNRPDDLIHLEVCALSGMLPTEHCPYTIWEWFIPGTAPTDYDTLYRQIDVDLLTGLPADGDTPPERIRSITFLDLPAFALEWAQREGLSVLPGEWVKSDQPEGTAFLRIVSPDFNAIYQIDPATPLQAQKLRLVAVGSTGLTDVTLRMDGKVVATFDAPPYETWWLLETGTHTLYAEATLPDGTTLTSDEVTFTVNPPAAP